MKRLGRRGLAIVVAVVIAAASAVALLTYVRGVEQEALAEVERVEVLVARERLPTGMRVTVAGEQGLIGREAVPRKLVPQGAVSSLGDLDDKIASVDIMPGETLIAGRFADPDEAGGVFTIPEGHQAMAVEVGVPPGVAGFVDSGDKVSVIASVEAPQPDDEASPETAAATEGPTVRYLLQNVTVLSIGQRLVNQTDGEPAGDQPATADDLEQSGERVLATLAVTPGQAEQLAFATLHGQVYLTLVADDQPEVTTPGRTSSNIFTE